MEIRTLFRAICLVPIFLILIGLKVFAAIPVADAGREIWATKYLTLGHIDPEQKVVLDGSGSYDPDGDDITYHWTLLDTPEGSNAMLNTGSEPYSPYFYADMEGIYRIQLIVDDEENDSVPDLVEIEAVKTEIESINWGNPIAEEKFGLSCLTPSIAMNDEGVIVIVYSNGVYLYYRVGKRLDGGLIEWGDLTNYSEGLFPSVAINNNGVVVEAHNGIAPGPVPTPLLYYKVGIVDVNGKTIEFGHSKHYTDGYFPSITINDDGVVVEAHNEIALKKLFYKVGVVNPDTKRIHLGSAQHYTDGLFPSVAITNSPYVLVEAHNGYLTDLLYHKVGTVNTGSKRVTFTDPVHYSYGFFPSISINDAGIVTEVHGSKVLGALYYKIGKCDGVDLNYKIHWTGGSSYSFGGLRPSVSLNNKNQFVEISYTPALTEKLKTIGLLYHSTSFFEPVKNAERWMEETPSVMNRKLKETYLPGTHDSGAYEFFKGLKSPTYVKQIEKLERVFEKLGLHPVADELETAVQKFALAQNMNIYDQLRGGTRYLDLRIYLCNDKSYCNDGLFHVHHSAVGNELSIILADIRKYMQAAKKELLVIQGWYNADTMKDEDHERLMDLIEGELEKYLYKNNGDEQKGYLVDTKEIKDLLNTPISEILKDGPKILFMYKDYVGPPDDYLTRAAGTPPYNDKCKYFWPVFDFWKWANTNQLYKLNDNQKEALEDYKYGEGPPSLTRLFRLQYIFTSQTDDFLMYGESLLRSLAAYRNSLHSLSQLANQQLGVFLNETRNFPSNMLITTDFFHESDAVARAIKLNQAINMPPTEASSNSSGCFINVLCR